MSATIIVTQCDAVVAIRSQAVSKGALGPELTGGVSGCASEDVPGNAIPVRRRPVARIGSTAGQSGARTAAQR